MRILSLIILLLVMAGVTSAQAATITAASCNYSDVNAVINGPTHTAVSGDTIIIPAGTCAWTSNLSTTVGITITGSGTPNTGTSTFGAGTLTTIIIDNAGGSNPLFTVTGITYGQIFTLSLIDIEPNSSTTQLISPISIAGTCTSSGCPNIRIDNIIFGKTTQWTENGNGTQASSMIRADNVFGVMDHNTIPANANSIFANVSLSAYLGVGAYGDNSWAQPDTFGSANAIYYENNSFYVFEGVTDMEFYAVGGGMGGVRQAGRFNQINMAANSFYPFGGHGLDTDGRPQGMRQTEVYGNTVTCTGGSCGDGAATFRAGGTGIIFGNSITVGAGAWINQIADFSIYRNVFGSTNGWNYCGGSGPYDTNDGVTYYSGTITSVGGSSYPGWTMTDSTKSWTTNQLSPAGSPYSVYDVTQGFWAEIASNTATTITTVTPIPESSWGSTGFAVGDSYEILRATVCADQGGRGAGVYVSGTTPSPSGPLNQALDPIYEFDDTTSGTVYAHLQDNDNDRLIANRDWYTDLGAAAQTSSTSPFNGTSGVGHGTLANRPTTCTPHVGYWATDQGNWNQSANGFGQGELFVCSATNTWSLYYTPYTYPHPLTSSGSVITYGDLNGAANGAVSIYDAELVAQYVVGLITLTPTQIQEAEVSSSTETAPSIYDAFLIAEYAVGLITQFPVQ